MMLDRSHPSHQILELWGYDQAASSNIRDRVIQSHEPFDFSNFLAAFVSKDLIIPKEQIWKLRHSKHHFLYQPLAG